MEGNFFKGTSADQDRRFSDKELKLLKTMKFPVEFDKKVDMRKVNLQVIRPWITKKVIEYVGFEDEVVVEYAMGLIEDKDNPVGVYASLTKASLDPAYLLLSFPLRHPIQRKCK
jgi:serine/arginine repetitive matrix protein 1